MSYGEGTPKIGTYETLLLKLDEGAFGALYRVAIGFATIPAYNFLFGNPGSEWTIIPFLLAVLFLVRMGLAVVRKIVSFPAYVVEIWAVRRRTAKYYDSYQWRKLVWIGVGLGLYLAISGEYRSMNVVLTLFCLLAGISGTLIWRTVAADNKLPKPAPRWRKSSQQTVLPAKIDS